MEHREHLGRFERYLLAGQIGGGTHALLGEVRDDAFHRRILVDADHGRAEGSLPSADLYDGRRHGGAVKRVGQIDARGSSNPSSTGRYVLAMVHCHL